MIRSQQRRALEDQAAPRRGQRSAVRRPASSCRPDATVPMVAAAQSRLMQFSELPRGSVPVAFGLTLAPGYGQRKYGYNCGNE